MPNLEYTSGDVTARLTLDIEGFKSNTEAAKTQADTLRKSLKSALNGNFTDSLKSSLEALKGEFASLIDESVLLKKIEVRLGDISKSVDKAAKSFKNMGNSSLSEFSKLQSEAKSLKASLDTLFKKTSVKSNLVNEGEFDKVKTSLSQAKAQLSTFRAEEASIRESAGLTEIQFQNWKNTLGQIEGLITNISAQTKSMKVGETTPQNSAPKTLKETSKDVKSVINGLYALGRAGHSITLQLEEGMVHFDNSLLNTKEKVYEIVAALRQGNRANFHSVASQVNTVQRELAQTKLAANQLVTTLRGMGESTGVVAPLISGMSELRGSMVATDEETNKLLMDIRKMDSMDITSLTAFLQNGKNNVAQMKAEVDALNQSLFKTNLAMDVEGFNNVGAFNRNTAAIEKTTAQIKELIAYTEKLGLGASPLQRINGELISLDKNLFSSSIRSRALQETLQGMTSPQLANLNGELDVTKSQLSAVTAEARLFKETLATINVPSFNNISTNNTPKINTNATQAIIKANEGNLNRVISSVNKVTTAYESLGSKGSISIEQVDGKLVKLSSDMVRSSEGAAQLRNMFSNLNTSQLVRLQGQLQSLAKNTDLLRSKTALCIDTMGNLRIVNLDKAKSEMDGVGKSSERTKNALNSQKRSVNALDTAYGILRRTLSLIIVMFGFQMALEVFQIGKAAMDASYKIKKFGEEMNWTGQQTQKFQKEVNRLQKIYPKLDMNENAKGVIEMGRIYNLSNEQATKLLETSSVLNSAFVKEGRSTKDATLAMKDYLDLGSGWTKRMSEITNKDELIATGYWDGKTQDVMAQMKALDAVLKKKHYYEMAKEIYTLDEAYQALQIRLGMFIGDGLKVLTPYIIAAVKGFLSLLDSVEAFGKSLAKNPLFQAVALFASVTIGVGLLSKALSMLKLKVIETFASFATALTANPPLLAIAITIGIIVTAVYELGKAWGWWDDIPSMLKRVAQELGTVRGQVIALGSALLTTVGYFALTKTKAIDILIDKIKEYIGLSKKAKDIEMTPGPTTTGDVGKTPKTPLPDTPDWKKGKFWQTVWSDIQDVGRQAIKAAAYIAVGMALMTEAILLINAPMLALAGTGWVFKQIEPQVRAGVEGLQLIAPTILAFAVPVGAIMVAFSHFEKIKFGGDEFKGAAKMIAKGMLLISEAIVLLVAPMWSFALLGALTAPFKAQVQQGIQAINQLTEALMALVPVIPMFAVAVALGAIAFFTEGVGLVAEAASIGFGILMVSFAIASLAVPLQAVANLGNQNIDINGVKKGAESIKQISIALQYLSTATQSIAMISISNLATKIANLYSSSGWGDLAGSMKHIENVVKDMESVASALSKMKIPKINTDELKKLGQVAEATKNINTAMKSLSEVANQNTGSGTKVTKLGVGIGAVQVDVIEEVKAKIKSINDFMRAFNGIGIVGGTENFSEKIKRIKDMGEAVKQINSAMSSLAGVGNSGGVVGALKGFYYGDQDNGKKFDVLLYNIGKMNEFAKKLSSLDTADVKGDALNRIKNIASHIPSITQSVQKINTSLGTGKIDSGAFYAKLNRVSNCIGYMRTFATSVSNLNTENVDANAISRVGWIVNDVTKIVDAVKTLQQKLSSGDKGKGSGDGSIDTKLGNVFTTLQDVQDFIKDIMTTFGADGSSNGDVSGVLSTFSSSLSSITSLAGKVNTLNSSLPDVGQDTNISQKLYNLFTTLQYLTHFLNTVNFNLGANGETVNAGGASGVFSMFSSALSQIVRIAWQVNTLNATLPPDQGNQLGQKLGALFRNLLYIKNFMSIANWNLGQQGKKGGGNVSAGISQMVIDLQNALNNLTKTVDSGIKNLSGKGKRLGSAIGDGFKAKISGMGKAMADQQRTISQAISAANHSADNMSVHFNTTKTRVGQLSTAVQTLKDKIDALPNSKTITISVNFQQNGSPDSQSGLSFSLPSAGFGRRLKGFKGLAGLKGFSGLGSLKKFSAPSIGGSFMDAFKSVIGGMKYRHYYGSKNNGDVSDTLNSGESNCVDGALATLQLAKMFGLDGRLGTTLVNGEGHAFAIIEGKIFDATAMQLLGKTKAPNVRYSASNPTSKSSKDKDKPKQEVHIIVDMTDSTFYGDKDFEKKIEKTFEKLSLKLLDVDKNTGV